MKGRGAMLLERGAELGRLRERIARASRRNGSVCVVEGPSGIGKTALLEACRDLAGRFKARVLAARAGILERELPWSLVRQLFASVIGMSAAERAGLLAGAAALAAPALGLELGDESGALHGLYWLTSNLSGGDPLLLAVDDAQWVDDASLGFLAHLAQRIGDLPVLLVLTIRRGETIPDPLAALLASPEVDSIELAGLSPAGSAALTRSALGERAAEEFSAACHTATGGNPFLLQSLLRELERDSIEPTAERASDVAKVTPGAVGRSVLLRLSRLPNGRRLAEALAVLGGRAELAEAAALGELERNATASAADALVATDILMPGRPLEFSHAIVREAIYREIPPYHRADLHARAARFLISAGAPAGRIAALLLETDPLRDPAMVAPLWEGAKEALASGAPGSAAVLLERALREPVAGEDRSELLGLLGTAEIAAGRITGLEHLRAAVEHAVAPGRRAQILLGLGRSLYVTGRPREAADAFDSGLREIADTDRPDPSLVAELQASWLTVARTEAPLRARATQLARGLAEQPPTGRSHGERALLSQLAGHFMFEAEPREKSLELAHLALADGDLIREETSDGVMWVSAMGALGWGDEFDAYDAFQEVLLEDARARGSIIGFANASHGYLFTHYHRGMLLEAIADGHQCIRAERDGWVHFLPAARAGLAWALIDRGQLDPAAATLAAARTDASWEQSTMQTLVLEAEARIHLARGQPQDALDAALAAGRIFDEALIPNPSIAAWRSQAAIAAAQLGDRERAEELLSQELTLARRYGAPRAIGSALIAAGVIRAGEDGLHAFEEAITLLSDSPARLEYTRGLVLYGAALRRHGRTKAAREMLRSGLDLSTRCGATALEERARVELSAAGARPRRPSLSGIDSLTPAELRVAELAARGMTNREVAESLFVSLRTVETHLTHVYRKLEIDSRSELDAALSSEATSRPTRREAIP